MPYADPEARKAAKRKSFNARYERDAKFRKSEATRHAVMQGRIRTVKRVRTIIGKLQLAIDGITEEGGPADQVRMLKAAKKLAQDSLNVK